VKGVFVELRAWLVQGNLHKNQWDFDFTFLRLRLGFATVP
jgi:hypothetical protein